MPRLTTTQTRRLFRLVQGHGRHDVSVRSFADPTVQFHFSAEMLNQYRSGIASLLSQLPDDMIDVTASESASKPWIHARYDFRLAEWGSMYDADILLAMGRALNFVSVKVLPDSPCDIPMCMVMSVQAQKAERLVSKGDRKEALAYWKYNYLRYRGLWRLRPEKNTL